MPNKKTYKTASEILTDNPELEKLGWIPESIGHLFNLRLVNGIRKIKSKRTYLNESEVLEIAKKAFSNCGLPLG